MQPHFMLNLTGIYELFRRLSVYIVFSFGTI